MSEAEDHPYSVACKCARYLASIAAISAAESAKRAERMLGDYYRRTGKQQIQPTNENTSYTRPWLKNRNPNSDEKDAEMLARFNGHPLRLRDFERGPLDRATFQRIHRDGKIRKVGKGLYVRVTV